MVQPVVAWASIVPPSSITNRPSAVAVRLPACTSRPSASTRPVDSAMALLGSGVNQKEVREDRGVSQATGESGPVLPEEFRAGLDEYFNRLERGAGGQ